MSEITLALYSDLTQKRLVTADGGALTLPPLFLGDTLVCTMVVLDRASDGTIAPRQFNIRSIKASIGPIRTPPLANVFQVQAPDPNNEGDFLTTGDIQFNAAAADVATAFTTAFESADWTPTVILAAPSCWLVTLAGATGEPIEFTTAKNTLSPTSFVRIRAFQDGGAWWYEIRLLQAPVAFNEGGFDQVLADPPSIRRIHSGAVATDGTPPADELQALTVPSDFVGTFFLNWNFRISGVLSNVSGPDDVAAGLNAMFTDGSTPFTATNPAPNQAYIDFGGALGGAPQNLITVTVDQAAPGIVTFSIPLDREDLEKAMRGTNTFSAPLEIEMEVVPDGADPSDPGVLGVPITLCQQSVTILATENYPEMQTVRTINWLTPPSPKTYIPFSPDQVITGQQHYTTVIGDGVHSSFAIVHNLGTDDLACPPMVSKNVRPGKILGYGTDFDATIDNDNQVTVNFGSVPAANSLTVCITTAGPISAFMAGLHVTIAQVDGLQTALDSENAAITQLQTLLPTGTLVGQAVAGGAAQTINLPDTYFVFPNGRLPSSFDPSKLVTAAGAATLPAPPALLPAIQSATITGFSDGDLPDSPDATVVYQNTGSEAIDIPSGGGRAKASLPVNGYVGWDGRYFYLLERAGLTNSFFPADFNLQLFPLLEFDRGLWQAGQKFSLSFTLTTQLILANTSAQYLLVIEWGVARSKTDPGATSTNLSKIDWFDAPLLTQRVILSGLAQQRIFGCVISRSTTNVMSATKQLQNAVSVADSCPLTPSFVFRARLIHFDTDKSVARGVGYVFASFSAAAATIQ